MKEGKKERKQEEEEGEGDGLENKLKVLFLLQFFAYFV
jgi:hypothetical protein